jgi:excisionase family DNA binding protein
MAGIFYTLEETAEKLRMTEGEVKKLIEEDKLREFRIGSDMLLKAEEVEAMAAEKGIEIEPKVEEEEPTPVTPVAETAELEASNAETTEPETGEIDLPEFELSESEEMEPKSPVLDTAALENLSVGEKVPVTKTDELEKQTTEDLKSKEVAAIVPEPKSRRRSKVKREVARTTRTRNRPRLTIGQWLFYGLSEDNPGAIIVLFLLLGGIIIGCLALGSFLYEIL